jgi:hypothetical protein
MITHRKTTMKTTVSTWADLKEHWAGQRNFLLEGECVPFEFDLPPIEEVVDLLRADSDASIGSGKKADKILMDSIAADFRAMPLEKAMASSFSVAHYSLGRFDAPGKFLHGFERRVLDPWRNALKAQGFSFDRCYPIIFISGRGCATNYHLDFSHVVAWQIYGTKQFSGLVNPDSRMTREQRVTYKNGEIGTPADLRDDEILAYEMKPGAVLWNVLLTPHWVDATDGVAMSINLSHGGVRLNGKLSRNEEELEAYRKSQGVTAPAVAGKY